MSYKTMTRRAEAQRVREERIVSGYIKYKHPEMFQQAMEFYQYLDKLYPQKKDLRRTNEYQMIKDSNSRKIRKYYCQKASVPGETPHEITDKTPHEITDNLVLRIPLMDSSNMETTNTLVNEGNAVEIPLQHETTNTLVNEGNAVEIPPQHETTNLPVETTLETPNTPDLTLMDDESLHAMINELREDPNIADFFSNIDFEYDNCPMW